jgi:hypothetical protein
MQENRIYWVTTIAENTSITKNSTEKSAKSANPEKDQSDLKKVPALRNIEESYKRFRRHSFDDNGGGYQGL